MAKEVTEFVDVTCPHRQITQLIEDGEPVQGWSCDACGTKLVTVHTLLSVVKATADAFTLEEI